MLKESKKKKVVIVLCGGHAATTALSTIEELIRRKKSVDWDLIWIGSKKAIEGKKTLSLESQIFQRKGVRSYSIISGRFQRKFTLWTIPSLLKVPLGFINAFVLILKIRPKVVVSFGGHAALPVVIAAWVLRIPVVVHEQTASLGLANKLSAPFAKKICLARKESMELLKSKKAVLVGNPVMSQIADIEAKETISNPPTVFITLGSRGSRNINEVVYGILDKLLEKYRVIHITGEADFEKFDKKRRSLESFYMVRYEVYESVDPMQIDGIYKEADIIVARAGANTVSEVIVTRRPALLIPIPWSHMDEQKKNALVAQKIGIAKILEQKELTGEKMLSGINALAVDWGKMVERAKNNDILDSEASQRLVDQIILLFN